MGKYLGATLAVVIGALAVAVLAWQLNVLAIEQPTMKAADSGQYFADATGNHRVYSLTLQTFPNSPNENPDWETEHHYSLERPSAPVANALAGPQDDWVTYGPTTALKVPAHAVVTITIENYDGATPLLNPFYSTPQGTIDGAMQVAMDPSSPFQPVTKVDPTNVSHTFTIHSIVGSNQPWLYVSVPITAVPDDRATDDNGFPQPVVTQFTFETGDPGHYIWQCFDPCGSGFDGFGGPMSTKGYMSGTLDVVA